MKTAAADLITLEGGAVRRPAEIYHFWRGASHWYYASGDVTVAWDDGSGSQNYLPAAIRRGDLSWNSNLQSGELDIEMDADAPVLADCLSGVAVLPAWVKIWELLYDDSDVAWPALLFVGLVRSAAATGPAAQVTLVGLDYFLKRSVPPRQWSPGCNWTVFGTECGLAGATYLITPTVTVSADGKTLTAAAFDAQDDGYFTYGSAEFGDYKRMILSHVGTDITLDAPLPGLDTGEVVTVYPGCDGDVQTCFDKYNNVDNFGGCPHIPIDNPALWMNK